MPFTGGLMGLAMLCEQTNMFSLLWEPRLANYLGQDLWSCCALSMFAVYYRQKRSYFEEMLRIPQLGNKHYGAFHACSWICGVAGSLMCNFSPMYYYRYLLILYGYAAFLLALTCADIARLLWKTHAHRSRFAAARRPLIINLVIGLAVSVYCVVMFATDVARWDDAEYPVAVPDGFPLYPLHIVKLVTAGVMVRSRGSCVTALPPTLSLGLACRYPFMRHVQPSTTRRISRTSTKPVSGVASTL
jgi:hypothetical protein